MTADTRPPRTRPPPDSLAQLLSFIFRNHPDPDARHGALQLLVAIDSNIVSRDDVRRALFEDAAEVGSLAVYGDTRAADLVRAFTRALKAVRRCVPEYRERTEAERGCSAGPDADTIVATDRVVLELHFAPQLALLEALDHTLAVVVNGIGADYPAIVEPRHNLVRALVRELIDRALSMRELIEQHDWAVEVELERRGSDRDDGLPF